MEIVYPFLKLLNTTWNLKALGIITKKKLSK